MDGKVKTTIGKKKQQLLSSVKQRATKRLMRDLQEILANPLDGVAALPLENNIFVWHANLKGPIGTVWEGGIFHMVLHFPESYPDDPPTITLATRMEHPNVFNNKVCLDILQKNTSSKTSYEGWTPAYTVQTILVQLQAFLFEADVNKVLANIANLKDYEKKKKEWLSAVKWSVEQSRQYKDKSVGHYAPNKIWPPFPEVKKNVQLSPMDIIKQELICFYTRQSFTEDCLGVGISFSKNLRTGKIKSIQSPFDLVSLRAFMNHKLRSSSYNQKFSHWLPIYIDEKHGQKASKLAERAISVICTGSADKFEPSMVLEVIPKLMNTMVVEVMSGKLHASLKALRGYCYFHRLFIMFAEKYPQLQKQCNEIIENFIKDEKNRHKDVVPNLGEILPLLSITKYKWNDIKDQVIEENEIRNVFWILSKYPELEQENHPEITKEDRLKYSFEVTKISHKLMYFNVFFLEQIAHPQGLTMQQVAKRYDEMLGRPPAHVEDAFTAACEKIWKLENYQEFYKGLGYNFTNDEIVQRLLIAIKKSKEKGYHGVKSSVLSPEEFAKKNKTQDLDDMLVKDKDGKLTLITDEAKWKRLCEERWSLTKLPEYLLKADNPWRRYFLQNNLQDFIAKMNDVPDFKLFYKLLDLGADEITRLEIQIFDPTNIKSRYYFLTAILQRLKKLDTLFIRKGEIGLRVKGFKALIKGLGKNPGALNTLMLEYCDIGPNAIKELTKGTLISSNLQFLSLRGNPLGDDGARNLADCLRQHQMLPNLTHLDLSDCKIGQNGANAIAEALLVKRKLKVLKMPRNPFNVGLDALLKNLAYSPSIEEVDISKSSGVLVNNGQDSLAKLFKLTVSLKHLNLWRVNGIVLHDVVLQELKNNTTLKSLDLGETKFTNTVGLGKALLKNTTLEELNLDGNQLTLSQLHRMYEELKSGKCNLKKLILSNNNFSSYVERSEHMSAIGNLLMLSKQLTVLNLENCKLTRDAVESIGKALDPQYKLPLKELSLKKNNLGKYGLKPLVKPLQSNTTLEKLDVSGNQLGVFGGTYLAEILKENKTLKELNAFGNLMEIEGAIAIAEALQKNNTLKILDIGLNRLRARGAEAIAKMLAVNTTLERIGLKHNRIADVQGMTIARTIVSNKNSSIKYIALAGNFLSVPIRSEIALLLSKSERQIEFDLAKLVEVKDPEKQEKTIYITPLPMDITPQQIQKVFYSNKCGMIISISIHEHKKRTIFSTAKYAFVEFAHPDSVQLAMNLVHQKKNKIGNQEFRIARAGVQNKQAANEESETKKESIRARGIRRR